MEYKQIKVSTEYKTREVHSDESELSTSEQGCLKNLMDMIRGSYNLGKNSPINDHIALRIINLLNEHGNLVCCNNIDKCVSSVAQVLNSFDLPVHDGWQGCGDSQKLSHIHCR